MGLPAWLAVDCCPALLTVVLEASDTATEKGSRFVVALNPTALIAHLVIQNIRFELKLPVNERGEGRKGGGGRERGRGREGGRERGGRERESVCEAKS